MATEQLNQVTQPIRALPVFNNWDVVANAWYFAFASAELKNGEVKKLLIGTQHLVVFRTEDGDVRCMDGFCPHMGIDLSLGKVIGSDLRCVFHHWKFDGHGACVDVPCQKHIPKNLKSRAYKTVEKYGAVWIHPDSENPTPFPEFQQYSGVDTTAVVGVPYQRGCHHHVPMINGIDPQHLRTIHNLNIEMGIEVDEEQDRLTYHLEGEVPQATLRERFARFLFGNRYGYTVSYAGGTLGLLTTLQHARLLGTKLQPPSLTMIFAYRPTSDRRTLVVPIYITKKRRGLFGQLMSRLLLTAIKYSFYALRDEDGQIYENIRFNHQALLPIDKPLGQFIAYVNRLTPSVWSKNYEIRERRSYEELEENAENRSLSI